MPVLPICVLYSPPPILQHVYRSTQYRIYGHQHNGAFPASESCCLPGSRYVNSRTWTRLWRSSPSNHLPLGESLSPLYVASSYRVLQAIFATRQHLSDKPRGEQQSRGFREGVTIALTDRVQLNSKNKSSAVLNGLSPPTRPFKGFRGKVSWCCVKLETLAHGHTHTNIDVHIHTHTHQSLCQYA